MDAQKGAILALISLYLHANIGTQLGIYFNTIIKFMKHIQEYTFIENLL